MVIDKAVEPSRPLRQAEVGKAMFSRTGQRQFVLVVELMVNPNVDLIAVRIISFTTSGERIYTVASTDPLITCGVQTIDTGCRLEVVRQWHGIENGPFDQTALVGNQPIWITSKHARRLQIPCRRGGLDGVAR